LILFGPHPAKLLLFALTALTLHQDLKNLLVQKEN